MVNEQKEVIEAEKTEVKHGDKTLFSINKIDCRSNGIEIKGELKDKIISFLSPIVSSIPNIGKTAQSMTSYEAVFSREMKEMLKNGMAVLRTDNQGKILPCIAQSSSNENPGQIIEQVRLKSGMTTANIVLMGWQIASMITAQRHLNDIDKNLENISKGVNAIKDFLEHDFFSGIEIELRYTRMLVKSIRESDDFFLEFEKCHANNLVCSSNNISKAIIRLERMIDIKIQNFSELIFKERKANQVVEKFSESKREIINLLGIFVQLIQAQGILCFIYELYLKKSVFVRDLQEFIDEQKSKTITKIYKFEEIVKDKIDNFDTTMSLWEYALVAPIAVVALPGIAVWQGLSKIGAVEGIDFESDIKKIKKIQYKKNSDEFLNIKKQAIDLFELMDKQKKSLDSNQKIAFSLNNGQITEIKLLV